MNRQFRFLALAFIALFLFACHRGQGANVSVYTPPPQPAASPYKVKVADVSNDTHQVFDVDVIGLMWEGVEDALKKRGMLMEQGTEGEPYLIAVHIIKFEKGNLCVRWLPCAGDTILVVRAEVKRGGTQLAAIELKRKIAYGKGTFTRHAVKKIFDQVSEEIVDQAVKKF
jgi:hypothetical protein